MYLSHLIDILFVARQIHKYLEARIRTKFIAMCNKFVEIIVPIATSKVTYRIFIYRIEREKLEYKSSYLSRNCYSIDGALDRRA